MTKINWANPTTIPLVASGVVFAPSSGGSTRYTVSARREVILAAGAIQTPALLQLSGIGDASVLGPIGITTLIDMKTVGRNLQEQACVSIFTFIIFTHEFTDHEFTWGGYVQLNIDMIHTKQSPKAVMDLIKVAAGPLML